MTDALFNSPAKTSPSRPRTTRSSPPAGQRADIAAQGKCLAVLQRAVHVVHVGKSGTIRLSRFSFSLKEQ